MPVPAANQINYSTLIFLLLVVSAVFFRSYQEYLLADFSPDKRMQTAIYYHYHQDVEDYLEARQSSAGEEALLCAPARDNDGLGIYASLLQIPLLNMTAIEGGIKTQNPVCILLSLSKSQRSETIKSIQSIILEYQLQPVKEFPGLKVKLYELCLP